MIASKKKTCGIKSHARHIRDTLDYIFRQGEHVAEAGAVAYARTLNMVANAEDGAAVFSEMLATAARSKRVKNPVAHIVFSLREGEHPTADQVDEIVKIALQELGYEGLQCAYALHTDHEHHHVHLAINRVDPVAGKCRPDYDDAMKLQKAVARIESRQGWQREARGRYEEIDGELVRVKVIDDGDQPLSEGAAMVERATGLKSVERIAIEDLKPIISTCKSWSELHERLALKGFSYQPKGGGAVIVGNFADGQTEVKASTVSNKFSLKKLEKVLGPFVASAVPVSERKPEPVAELAGRPEVDSFIEQRIAAKKNLSAIVARHEEQLKILKKEREEIYKALRSVPDADEKKEVLAAFREVFSEYTQSEFQRIEKEFTDKMKVGKEVLRNVSDLEVWLSLNCPGTDFKIPPLARTVRPVTHVLRTHMNPTIEGKKSAFLAYHAVVGADRYRVTIRKKGNVGFVLGKKKGQPSDGFTPEGVIRMLENMQKEEAKGGHVYLTPLSEKAVHVLVDDMTAASLAKMKADGFLPNVVLESSPGNYQAIFTIPTPENIEPAEMRLIANSVSRGLNSRYGDINLSGAVHPHRTPGFENVKEKYRDEQGNFPTVSIVEKNPGVVHEKLYQFMGYEHELLRGRQTPAAALHREAASVPMTETAGRLIYEAHRTDILRINNFGETADTSRIDAMIAQRLVATGHGRDDVKAILEAGVDRQRTHDWTEYISATVAYAFDSPESQRVLDRLSRYHGQWAELENGAVDVSQEQKGEDAAQGQQQHDDGFQFVP